MADDQNLKISERILKLREGIAKLTNQETELTEKQTQELYKQEASLAKILKYQEKRVKAALGTKQVELDIENTLTSQLSDLSSISSIYTGLTKIQKSSLDTNRQIVDSVKESMLTEDSKREILTSTLKGVGDLQGLQQKIAETGPENLEQQKALQASYDSELNKLQEIIVAKAGSQEITETEALALNKLLDTQQSSLESALRYGQVSASTKQLIESQIAVYDGIKKSIGGVLDTARLLTSNLSAGIGLSVVALGQVVGKISDVNTQFGMTLFSTDGIARNTALMNVFFDDAAGTSEELASQFGSTEAASFKTQLNTNLLARNLGISGKEAATLVGSFSRLNGNSTDIANDLIVSTRELAKQNGVIPSKVMADLANSTEAFALYGKNGGKNIAQAAVYAAKLGVGMDKLTGIADNLLDFESSITKELELSALLGKNINLNQARQLAYSGQIEEATAETLRQLGGIDAFNRMDYFQKKASADLLGVSVAELQQMVQNQDKANEKATVFGETYSMLNEKATALSNIMGGPFLSTLGSGLVALGQMGFNVKGMLASISKKIGLQKLYNFLINGELITRSKNWIGEKLSAGWELLKIGYQKIKLALMGKETAMLVKQRMLSEKQIASGFGGKKAKDMLLSKSGGIVGDKSPLSTTTKPTMESPIGKKGGIMDSMSKIKMNDVLKGAAAMLVVAGAVFVFGKAVQEFMKVSWESVGMAVVSMFALVGAVTLLGLGMKVAGPFILVGAAAMLVIATSVLVLGHAIQAIGKGFEMLSGGIASMIPNLTSVGAVMGGIIQYIVPISALSLALGGLALALTAVGVAGIAALPGLMAVAAVGTIAMGVGSLLGFGGGTGGTEADNGMDELLTEIKGLRADLNSGKISVYMDGKKVSSSVNRVMDKIGTNFYGAT
jgi:hypothetical protein